MHRMDEGTRARKSDWTVLIPAAEEPISNSSHPGVRSIVADMPDLVTQRGAADGKKEDEKTQEDWGKIKYSSLASSGEGEETATLISHGYPSRLIPYRITGLPSFPYHLYAPPTPDIGVVVSAAVIIPFRMNWPIQLPIPSSGIGLS